MISTKITSKFKRPFSLYLNLFITTFISFFIVVPSISWAAAPRIIAIEDQIISRGGSLELTPALQGDSNSSVNWSIAYGPDEAEIAQGTGTVTWNTSSSLPAESFYIGLQASNKDGTDIEYFIVHVGVPKIVYVGPSHEIKDLEKALTANQSPGNQFREPGTTFVVENGSYTTDKYMVGLTPGGNLQLPPTGNAEAYSTVMAQTPGGVTLSDQALIAIKAGDWDPSYMAIKGFYINKTRLDITGSQCALPSAPSNCIKPHHIKFVANGINLGIESDFGASDSSDLLFENNYVFGGRRVKLHFFRAERVVARRNVARFDWVTESSPQNTFSFYSTVDAYAQNNIAIDSDNQLFWIGDQDAGEFGCPVSQGDSKVSFTRNIQLNSEKSWGNMDSQSAGKCVADMNNNLSWDVRPRDVGHVMAQGAVNINHMTIGKTEIALNSDEDGGIVFGFPGDSRGFYNSVIHDTNSSTLFGYFPAGTTATILGQSYQQTGIHHINLSLAPGQLLNPHKDAAISEIALDTLTNVNPIYSLSNQNGSLKYIVRSEPNTNLSNLATDGTALGATIMTMRGKSGTIIGQSGYNQETGHRAWPFPLQDVIQEKMSSMRYSGPTYTSANRGKNRIRTGNNGTLSGNRGFAQSGQDLTHYIWGYLGNAVPPMNVTAQTDGENTIIRWDKAPSAYLNHLTGFKVYDFNSSTGQMSNPRNVGPNQFETTIPSSGGRTDYVVTAVHRTAGEGGYSYPSSGTHGLIQQNEIQEKVTLPPAALEAEEVKAEEETAPELNLIPPTLRVIEVTNSTPVTAD